jgi:hypothetical protein
LRMEENPDLEQLRAAEERYLDLKRKFEAQPEEISPVELDLMGRVAEQEVQEIADNLMVNQLGKESQQEEPLVEKIPEAAPVESSPETPEEIKKEIEALPEKEKRSLAENLRRMGFWLDEKKNASFAKFFDKLGGKVEERSAVGRIVSAARDHFANNAEGTRRKEKGLRQGTEAHSFWNATYLFGNLMRYGRIITDLTARTTLAPLRGFMLIGSTVDFAGGIGKEARLASDEVREKTWIKDTDAEPAADEAWKIYEAAQAKAGEKPVSAEDLEDAYRRDLPHELQEKLKQPEIAFWTLQNLVHRDIERSVEKLNRKLTEIEADKNKSAEDKEREKAMLLRRWDRNLRDYDRIIDRYGKIDELAMIGRYAQAVGKGLMYGSGLAALGVALDKLWENLSQVLSDTDARDTVRPAALPKVVADTAVGEAPADTTNPPAELPDKKFGVSDLTPGETKIETKIAGHELNLDEKGVETIVKGSSVSGTIDKMVEKGEISVADAKLARNNPLSGGTVDGKFVNIDKLGLVHEGNQVKFIQVLESSGKTYGTDKDLYARYQELGKKAPDWLEKSVTGKVSAAEIAEQLSETVPDTAEAASQSVRTLIGETMTLYIQSEFPNMYSEYSTPESDTILKQFMDLIELEEEFESMPLITQRITVESLQPVKDYVENLLQDEVLASNVGVRRTLMTMRESIEHMEEWNAKTEKALADKFYELDIKKPAEMDALLADKKTSVRTLLERHLEKPDYSKEKLFNWIKSMKPDSAELKLNLDTFIRSRFR